MKSDFKLRELDLKVHHHNTNTNTNTRRFSASNFKSFREDGRFVRSSPIVSSTVSSPGYTTTDKFDPSTYTFTAALRAIQGKERLSLNSKWSDAEKYISNPLSGEVPLECLSAKTLSARSFRTNKITIHSGPFPHASHFQTKFPTMQHHHKLNITIQEKKRLATRDVGVQSTPADLGGGDEVAPPTPPIEERSRHVSEGESVDSCDSPEKAKLEDEVEEEREAKEKEGGKAKLEGRERKKLMVVMMKMKMMMRCSHNHNHNHSHSHSHSQGDGGSRRKRGGCLCLCLPLKGLWGRDRKGKSRKNNKISSSSSPNYPFHINASYHA